MVIRKGRTGVGVSKRLETPNGGFYRDSNSDSYIETWGDSPGACRGSVVLETWALPPSSMKFHDFV